MIAAKIHVDTEILKLEYSEGMYQHNVASF